MAGTIDIAANAAQQSGNTVGDALQAYHVASTAANARQGLEMEKQNNQINKANFVMQQLDKIGRTVGPAQDIMLDSFGKHMQILQPGFDPSTLQVLKKDSEAIKNFAWAASQNLGKGGARDADQANSILQTFGNLDAFTGYMSKIGEMKTQVEAGQAKAQGFQARVDEQKNQNAVSAGHAWEADPIIKNSKQNLNSIAKSQSILNDPKAPVTTKALNLAYQDYINATAAGGAATEGKVNRELPDTWAQQWNDLKQKIGDTEDLRKSAAGRQLINILKQNITTVKGDLGNQIADQSENLVQNYQSNTNPRVQATVQAKHAAYSKFRGGGAASKPAQAASAAASIPAAPKAGDIVQGYRFKGGDPSQQANWEQQ